jgi:hypothetical protein
MEFPSIRLGIIIAKAFAGRLPYQTVGIIGFPAGAR